MFLIVEDDVGSIKEFQKIKSRETYIFADVTSFKQFVTGLETDEKINAVALDGCVNSPAPNTINIPLWLHKMGYNGPIIAISGSKNTQRLQLINGCSHSCEKQELPDYIQQFCYNTND